MIRTIIAKFQKERDLTSVPISQAIWLLALPMIISHLLQASYNLIDMIWVGRLGADALAAVSMSGTILMIVMFVMIGIGIGTTALVARNFGAKKFSECGNVALQSLIMGLIGSIILTIIGYLLAPALLKLLGADPTVLMLGTGYLRILFMGVVLIFSMFFIAAILQGAGDSTTPMIILGFSVILNIILDPLLIFGIGPFPQMGVNGAALATVIAEGVGSLMALEVLLKGRSRIHLKLKNFRIDFTTMWRILKIGIPSSAQMLLRGFMGLVLISIVAGFGTYAIAAYGVGMRLTMLAMMPGFALGAAAATLVGQNLGAQKPERAVASAWAAVGYYFIFMTAIAIAFFTLAPQLMSVFNSNPTVIKIGSEFLKIVAFGHIFIAIGLILGRAIAGAGDTIATMIFTFISLWLVQIPLAFFLAYKTSLGLNGVWYAVLISQLVLASLNTFWFQLGRWKQKKV